MDFLQAASIAPCAGDEVTICILLVKVPVLELGAPGAQYIVEDYAALHNPMCADVVRLYGGQQAPPSAGHDAKGILQHPPHPRGPVFEDLFLLGQPVLGVGLHHVGTKRKGIVPNQEVGHVLVIIG